MKIRSFYPLAVLWTGTLSACKLPFNEHICAYSLFLCWVKICSFLLPPLLAVLWTGALSARKLQFNEHVCAYSFCVEWNFVPSFTSFTHLLCCELVHSQSVSCNSMDMFVPIHFVLSENSFFYLLYTHAVLWTLCVLRFDFYDWWVRILVFVIIPCCYRVPWGS